MEQALAEIDEAAEPRRASEVLGDLATMRWTLGRGEAARDTLAHALELLPEDEQSRERAKLLVDQVRFSMLQGRYRQTRETATDALAAIDAAGADDLYAPVLNRLGVALMCDGEPELGAKTLRDALDLAREAGLPAAMAVTYANLADGLHVVGRSRGGARGDPRGARRAAGSVGPDGDLAAGAGGHDRLRPRGLGGGAAPHPAPACPPPASTASTRSCARRSSSSAAATTRRAPGCCWTRPVSSSRRRWSRSSSAASARCRESWSAGRANLDAAREVVEAALDRLEFCTEDVRFLSQVAATGAAIEADAAERARDVGDDAARDDALERLEPILLRVEAAAIDGRPMEVANLATANAEATRGRGEPDPAAWAAAAEAWATASRPYPEAQARQREAEAHVAAGDREAAAVAAGAALATARVLGSAWLATEAEGLIARARLRVDQAEERGAARARRRPRRSRSG